MKRKILTAIIGSLLATSANAEFVSVIEKFKQNGGYVESPQIKLSYLYIEETDSEMEIQLPISIFGGAVHNGSVNYEVTHVTTTDSDVVLASGKLDLSKDKKVPVKIKGDFILESDETFRVTLSNPDIVRLVDGEESFDYVIKDNDTLPTVSVKDLEIVESDSDIVANVLVELSKGTGTPVSVNFATEVDTASNLDFVSNSGTVNFAVGETQKIIPITIKGDTLDEFDESFKVKLSNSSVITIDDGEAIITIKDNDDAPTLSIQDDSFMEGDLLENKTLTVNLSKASSKDISVDFTTSEGTADSSDFVIETKTITIPAGQTTGDINIQVHGDYTMEDNETLNVTLSNPVNSTIANSAAEITLDNDDTEYEFNTLPLYGKVEFYNTVSGQWEDVIANFGYERDVNFRYNPTESEVLKVSRDIEVGSFDTNPGTPGVIDGTHGLSEWGSVSGNTSTFTENGVKITSVLSHGNIKFDQVNKGLGSSSFSNADPATNYYEIEAPMKFTVTLEGDFLNDVEITAAALGGCFDVGAGCETKVSIDAFDADGNLLDSQGGYRQSGIAVDSYYFTGEVPIKTFHVYPTPTNQGGNNGSFSSGNFVFTNMTVSRSAFEVIDYKYTDIDETVSTERINLNINEGNANVNVDLNPYLLGQ